MRPRPCVRSVWAGAVCCLVDLLLPQVGTASAMPKPVPYLFPPPLLLAVLTGSLQVLL